MKRKRKRKFNRSGWFYVYILECRDGSYYTGYTNDLKKRLNEHTNGKGAKYTRDRRPLKLVWKKEYKRFKYAVKKERSIKQLTRKEKEALIEIYEKSKEKS